MEKTNAQGNPLQGKAGMYSWYLDPDGNPVMRIAENKPVKKQRTEKDLRHMIAFKNPAKLWSAFDNDLKPTFEKNSRNMNNFNAFMSLNSGIDPVFLTKKMTESGACIVTHAQISQGTLPFPITIADNSQHVAISDRAIGNRQRTDSTTVSQFSAAVINNNAPGRFLEQDIIGCYLVHQRIQLQTTYPIAMVEAARVCLNTHDTKPLYDVVDPLVGFQATNGFLSFAHPSLTLGSYLQTRPNPYDDTLRLATTQFLQGDNPLIQQYSTLEAFTTAADTYGGIRPQKFMADTSNPLRRQTSTPADTPSTDTQVTIATAVSPSGAGTVTGAGSYAPGTEVTLTATANNPTDKPFTKWSDGVTQNPRTVTATANATYTAIFGTPTSGGDGGID